MLAAGCCWGICNPIWNVEIAGYWGIYWLSLPGYLSSIVRSQLMEILHLQMITQRSSHHNTQHTSKQFSDSIWHFIGWTILSVVILFTEDLQLPDAQSSWLLLPELHFLKNKTYTTRMLYISKMDTIYYIQSSLKDILVHSNSFNFSCLPSTFINIF